MEQLQSKNTVTVPMQVSSFLTLKSLTVNQCTGVRAYNSNGKKMDKKKGEREEGMKNGKKKEGEGGREGEEERRRGK